MISHRVAIQALEAQEVLLPCGETSCLSAWLIVWSWVCMYIRAGMFDNYLFTKHIESNRFGVPQLNMKSPTISSFTYITLPY